LDLFAITTKKLEMPASTMTTTASRLKIPQFIPLAREESDAP
jgi:hypothetical protein